jgi:hypothetical protein
VVGSPDDDGVNIFASEDLVVVAGGEDVVAPKLLGASKAAVVAVGHGNELDAGHLDGGFGVAHTLAARANERNLDVIVSGYWLPLFCLSQFRLSCGKQMQARHQRRGGCDRRGTQKAPAIPNIHGALQKVNQLP